MLILRILKTVPELRHGAHLMEEMRQLGSPLVSVTTRDFQLERMLDMVRHSDIDKFKKLQKLGGDISPGHFGKTILINCGFAIASGEFDNLFHLNFHDLYLQLKAE